MSLNSPLSGRHNENPWHPTDYLRIVYKRRWIAITGFLLLFLSGAVQSIRSVPMYEASTQILLEQDTSRRSSIDELLEERDGFDEEFYQTQYMLMRSRSLAARTAVALENSGPPEEVPEESGPDLSIGGAVTFVREHVSALVGGEEARSSPDEEVAAIQAAAVMGVDPDKIDSILDGLSIEPVRDSRLVNIVFESPDPGFAARAANELARQYQQQVVEARFAASQADSEWLTAQVEDQRKRMLASDAALQAYRETQDAASVSDSQNIVVQRLTELNAQVTRARIDRLDKEAYYNRIQEIQRSGESLESVPAILANEVVQGLKIEINRMRAQLAELRSQGFGDGWPAVRDLTTRVVTAESRLQAEMGGVVDSIRNSYMAARTLENSLASALEAQKNESMALDRKSIEYAALEREAESNRTLFEDLVSRTKESTISGQYRGSNVQVVDPAERPQRPVSPNVRRDLLMAALRGTVLALVLVFGLEYFDNRLRTPEELKTHLRMPFLGLIPMAGKNSTGEAALLSADVPPAFSEAIRSMRTAVLFSSADEGARTLVVTSTGPGEGKTMVSSSLAIALAQAGQRTLIVDADMRRPRMHEALARAQEPGLSNVLVGETKLDEATRPTSVPNLQLLPAGQIPPNPSELIASKKFQHLHDEIRRRFDWIIIDAPPVMPVTDAAILGNVVGSVLFVVGSEMTARQAAMAAVEQLRAANVRFVGAVLNRVNVERHGYYYAPYYRKSYAKYYQRSNA